MSQLEWLEHELHAWSSFVIVPLFALANAGVPLSPDASRRRGRLARDDRRRRGPRVGQAGGDRRCRLARDPVAPRRPPRGCLVAAHRWGLVRSAGSASRCRCSSPGWRSTTRVSSTRRGSASWPRPCSRPPSVLSCCAAPVGRREHGARTRRGPPARRAYGRGADGDRTRYLLDAIEALYQLSYGPVGLISVRQRCRTLPIASEDGRHRSFDHRSACRDGGREPRCSGPDGPFHVPLFDAHGRVDLVADRGDGLLRLQCKTARLLDGVVVFRTCSNTRNQPLDYRDEVDAFGVYSPTLDRVYLVPVDEVGIRGASLRVEPVRNGQSLRVRWAADYLIGPP